jgi:two-component system, NtrC family, response regulator AtoC
MDMEKSSFDRQRCSEVFQQNRTVICASDKMERVQEIIDQVANTDVTILIRGETGVGKEIAARSIHQSSLRKAKAFIKVNCAALPQELLESELFGYEKGAFTGAYRGKPGKFELADEGTIFLDEISEIILPLQAKLLQVLQDREFSRLGGEKDIQVDARILATTNKNMEEALKNGSFREDLYYRLNVVNITIPPLRERQEEILAFVEYFLHKFQMKYSRQASSISEQMMRALLQYQWPGNIRELENLIQRFVLMRDEEEIIGDLYPIRQKDRSVVIEAPLDETDCLSLKVIGREAVKRAEAEIIRKTLHKTNWNRKEAAGMLKISYKALLYKIKGFGLSEAENDLAFPPAKISTGHLGIPLSRPSADA